jgi:hypothetical protein
MDLQQKSGQRVKLLKIYGETVATPILASIHFAAHSLRNSLESSLHLHSGIDLLFDACF